MKHIGEKLVRHKDTLLAASLEREHITRAVERFSHILISEGDIHIRGTTIRLTISPMKRQKVLMYKKSILEDLELKKKYKNIF